MTPIERVEVKQGAKFIKVLCSDPDCHIKGWGEKQLLYQHNGYESDDAKDVQSYQEKMAQATTNQHLSERPRHLVRIIKGT